MTQTIEDDEISLLGLLQLVADNLRLLVLGPLAVGLLALGFTFTIAPTFTATTKFLPPQQQQSGGASFLTGLGALDGLRVQQGLSKTRLTNMLRFLKASACKTRWSIASN